MGDAFLTDFGLARASATGSKYTRTGQALGTPAYMSPEQARGETGSLAPATDVWGLGCVLYELLAGHIAFEGDTTAAVIGRVLSAEPPPIRRVRPDLPVGIETVLAVSLSKSAGRRYPHASELRDDLDRILRGERPRARLPRGRRAVAVAAAVALGALGLAAVAWRTTPTPTRAVGGDPAVVTLLARARALAPSDPAGAERLFTAAIERGGDAEAEGAIAWRVERGLLRWASGHSGAARADWASVPAASPHAITARLYAGLTALFDLDGDAAYATLGGLARGEGREARLAQAAIAASRARWAEARAILRGQEGWEAALLRGYVEHLDEAGDALTAIRELDAGLVGAPLLPWALNARALCRDELGDTAGALADLDRALGAHPDFTAARINRASVLRSAGRLDEARREVDAALAVAPDSRDAIATRAKLRADAGDLEGAIGDWTRVLGSGAADASALVSRAICRQRAGDPEGAILDCTAALGLDPRDASALLNRGAARMALDDWAGARADYDAALVLDPGDATTLANRGGVRLRLGDAAGAIADCTAALAADPGRLGALVNRAGARLMAGEFAGARADAEAALQAQADHPEALVNLGVACRALQDFPAAARTLGRLLVLFPDHPQREALRELLEECLRESGAGAGKAPESR